jgi:hypothetical protein
MEDLPKPTAVVIGLLPIYLTTSTTELDYNLLTNQLARSPRRIASRGGARSGWGGEAPRLGALEDTMTSEQKIIRAKVGLQNDGLRRR